MPLLLTAAKLVRPQRQDAALDRRQLDSPHRSASPLLSSRSSLSTIRKITGSRHFVAHHKTKALPTRALWTGWHQQASMRAVPSLEDDPHAASEAFGRRLRALRAERGISQDDLADATGIHPTAIGRMERGSREPRLTTILRCARGLSVAPGTLIDDL